MEHRTVKAVATTTNPEVARVRTEWREVMLALIDAADKHAPKPERKTAAPIQIASFES